MARPRPAPVRRARRLLGYWRSEIRTLRHRFDQLVRELPAEHRADLRDFFRSLSEPIEPGVQGPRRVRIHLMEIDHGGFCREVELPEDVDKDRIAANYRNGMLWIELPPPGLLGG